MISEDASGAMVRAEGHWPLPFQRRFSPRCHDCQVKVQTSQSSRSLPTDHGGSDT
jgi:hypothetical protein